LYGGKYNPERFWFLWGLTYKRVFYKRYLLKGNVKRDNLGSLVEALDKLSFESLLEVGCGYGICLQQIQSAFPSKSIHGCDISWTQLVQARRFLGADSGVVLAKTNGVDLPYDDNSFDVVLTYGVCIHVPPDKIGRFIAEIMRVTKRHYVFIESSSGDDSFFYFSHDYERVFTDLGLKLRIVKNLLPAANERLYIVDAA
jgi:ubiquinone/menaquinone biosynthesis C-methylase UbiE